MEEIIMFLLWVIPAIGLVLHYMLPKERNEDEFYWDCMIILLCIIPVINLIIAIRMIGRAIYLKIRPLTLEDKLDDWYRSEIVRANTCEQLWSSKKQYKGLKELLKTDKGRKELEKFFS